ncbi:MAG: alpha/beta hydrolase [Anaerolineae bacterium]|nr:alpha/beta hydrolase [Anaerolineae bacterium]
MTTIAQTSKGDIEYRVAGQGQPVLVLNGGHTNCNSPLGHEQFLLTHGYQLIVPSRPGYGQTPAATGKSAEEAADALVALLDHLNIAQVVVVGISAGGRTTLQLAGRHPDRVSKVILQNAITGEPYPEPYIRLGSYVIFNPWIERWTWAAFRAFASISPRAALTSMMGSLTTLKAADVVNAMTEDQRNAALDFLLSSRSGSGFLLDINHVAGDLSRITAPTLIIDSQYDGAKSPAHAAYAARHIPNAELFITPAESHLLWFSQHNAAVEAKMEQFLKS